MWLNKIIQYHLPNSNQIANVSFLPPQESSPIAPLPEWDNQIVKLGDPKTKAFFPDIWPTLICQAQDLHFHMEIFFYYTENIITIKQHNFKRYSSGKKRCLSAKTFIKHDFIHILKCASFIWNYLQFTIMSYIFIISIDVLKFLLTLECSCCHWIHHTETYVIIIYRL